MSIHEEDVDIQWVSKRQNDTDKGYWFVPSKTTVYLGQISISSKIIVYVQHKTLDDVRSIIAWVGRLINTHLKPLLYTDPGLTK